MVYPNRVVLNINQKYVMPIPYTQQGDTARVLTFNILDKGVPFNLTGKTVRAKILKPDNTKCYNDLTITNATNGECTLKLTNQVLAVAGKVNCQLEIKEGEELLSTIIFPIDVEPSIDINGAVESTNEFTALLNGIIKLDEWDKYFKETSGAIEEKYTERLNGINSSLEDTTAQVVVLNTNKVDKIIGKGLSTNDYTNNEKSNVSLIPNKADVTYVDTKVSQIVSGSPKGAYASLSALQTAKPTGDTGIYLTSDNGHWYYWNGTAWTDGGIYQSMGIADKSIGNKNLNDDVRTLMKTNLNELSIFELGYTDTDGVVKTANTRITNKNELIEFKTGDIVYSDSTIKFYGVKFDSTGTFISVLFNFTNSYTFTENCYIRFTVAYVDNREITDIALLAKNINVISPSKFTYSDKKIDSLISNITNSKALTGIKWVVVGDSTTDSTVHTANKYHYWVSQDLGITVVDFGKSGTGYKRTEENNTAFYQRVATIPNDTDIVTIFGLGNDCSQNYTVGTINDADESTWCGAVNKTIDIILQQAPLCNIALVSPYQWGIYPTNTDNKMKELSQKLKEIAENRGIEFLDLYKNSSVRPNDTTFNNYYFNEGDKVHLNELGHKKFLYPKFKQLVLSLTNTLS